MKMKWGVSLHIIDCHPQPVAFETEAAAKTFVRNLMQMFPDCGSGNASREIRVCALTDPDAYTYLYFSDNKEE